MKELRGEEQWARTIISTALGVPVEQHDDGSRDAMHDLWIMHGDGSRAAVEVTLAADAESIELWRLMDAGGRKIVEGLAGGWLVWLDPSSARARTLATQLPAFLGELERAGVRSVDVEPGDDRLGSWAKRARDLGIASADQSGTNHPGSVYVSLDSPLERRAGMVAPTGDAIAPWVSDFLAAHERRDVLAKLAKSGVQDRHACVLVPGFTTAPFAVTELLMSDRARLPTIPPVLPSEVTHVWIVGMWHDVAGFYWSPETGWSAVRTPPAPALG